MTQGVLLDPGFAQQLAEMFRWYQGFTGAAGGNNVGPRNPSNVDQRARPDFITVFSEASTTIPPYGCMKITGAKLDSGRIIITVDRPNDDGGPFLFNGPREIPFNAPKKFGEAQPGPVVIAARLSSEGTPAVGETWGPTTACECRKLGQPALLVWGNLNDNLFIGHTGHRQLTRLGKTDSTVTAGGTGTVSIWSGSGTASDTGDNSTAELDWCDGGEGISSSKEVIIQWFPDEGQFRFTHAECE